MVSMSARPVRVKEPVPTVVMTVLPDDLLLLTILALVPYSSGEGMVSDV